MRLFLRRWWALLAVAVIALGFIIAGHKRAQDVVPAAPAVKLATAQRGTFLVRVQAHGRVGPPPGSSAALAFPEPGRIGSIDVRVGDAVLAGQALAQLETQPFVLSVAQARGDAETAGGTLLSTTSSVGVRVAEASAVARQGDLKVQADMRALDRAKTLFAAGITAAKDVQAAHDQLAADQADAQTAHIREQALRVGVGGAGHAPAQSAPDGGSQARADVLTARGQADRAQAALAQAEQNLANATLRAPASGIVVAILKHPGESVDQTTPVVTLGAPLERSATLSVPASQATSIRVGDSAQLRLSRSAKSFPGRVTAVVAAVDPGTQQATVVVSGLPPESAAGDAVEATIVVASVAGILVPTSAIVVDPQTGDTLVFVASTGKDGQRTFEPRTVRVGPGDETTTQIQSGLRQGERVAAEGAFELLAPAAGSSD